MAAVARCMAGDPAPALADCGIEPRGLCLAAKTGLRVIDSRSDTGIAIVSDLPTAGVDSFDFQVGCGYTNIGGVYPTDSHIRHADTRSREQYHGMPTGRDPTAQDAEEAQHTGEEEQTAEPESRFACPQDQAERRRFTETKNGYTEGAGSRAECSGENGLVACKVSQRAEAAKLMCFGLQHHQKITGGNGGEGACKPKRSGTAAP